MNLEDIVVGSEGVGRAARSGGAQGRSGRGGTHRNHAQDFAVLAQLVSHMAFMVRFGGSNKADVVAKLKGLISEAYCNTGFAETFTMQHMFEVRLSNHEI